MQSAYETVFRELRQRKKEEKEEKKRAERWNKKRQPVNRQTA